MLWAVWAALAFAVLATAFSAALLAVRALDAWRAFRSLRRRLREAQRELDRRLDGIEPRVAKAGASTEELQRAQARLSRTLAEARVLAAAAGEARRLVRSVRSAVPRG